MHVQRLTSVFVFSVSASGALRGAHVLHGLLSRGHLPALRGHRQPSTHVRTQPRLLPSVLRPPEDAKAHSGVCRRFHWVKDGQPIRSGLHSGTLLAEEDEPLQQFEGHYRCYASNIYGTAMTQSVHVIVEGESHMRSRLRSRG